MYAQNLGSSKTPLRQNLFRCPSGASPRCCANAPPHRQPSAKRPGASQGHTGASPTPKRKNRNTTRNTTQEDEEEEEEEEEEEDHNIQEMK